jgi:hypothetical protein
VLRIEAGGKRAIAAGAKIAGGALQGGDLHRGGAVAVGGETSAATSSIALAQTERRSWSSAAVAVGGDAGFLVAQAAAAISTAALASPPEAAELPVRRNRIPTLTISAARAREAADHETSCRVGGHDIAPSGAGRQRSVPCPAEGSAAAEGGSERVAANHCITEGAD